MVIPHLDIPGGKQVRAALLVEPHPEREAPALRTMKRVVLLGAESDEAALRANCSGRVSAEETRIHFAGEFGKLVVLSSVPLLEDPIFEIG